MKILVVHQYYLMAGQGGGSRFNELARLWSDLGHDVTVIAGTVDYGTGERPERYRGRWLTRERDGAVDVIRCYVPPSYSKSYVGRMWAFFGFTLSAATAALFERDADVVIATSPPLITPMPAWIAARLRLRPAKLVFEIRDLWPESAVTTGVLREKSLLTRLLYGLEREACRAADRINVLTPAFRDDLVRRGLAPPEKIMFVPNGADVETFVPGPRHNRVRETLGWRDRIVFLYAGAHGRANAIGQLLDAARELRDRPDILIVTVGDGPERAALLARLAEEKLDNVQLHGAVPKAEMVDFVNACDVGVAVLQHNPTFRTVYPNKVFDYMACERPVLLAIDGVARKLVCDEARAGLFAQPEDGKALAAAMRRLADDETLRARLGASGRAWVTANASRPSLARRYVDELRRPPARKHLQRGLPSLLKSLVDRTAGALGLAATWPIIAGAALAVRAATGESPFFTQLRPGRDARPFKLWKLRTMRDARDAQGRPLPDAARLTRVGELLRKTSLDELPQLWNVVRGDLSLVGPRPLLMQYLERYSPEQARRHSVKPGITGWAQVNGRNALSWDEKFAHDLWYVDNWSLWLDARILFKTVAAVVRPRGISSAAHATMPEFMGSAGAAAGAEKAS